MRAAARKPACESLAPSGSECAGSARARLSVVLRAPAVGCVNRVRGARHARCGKPACFRRRRHVAANRGDSQQRARSPA